MPTREVAMVSLPDYLTVRYRLATTGEIRGWSFGEDKLRFP
jgi:hypothetical protein